MIDWTDCPFAVPHWASPDGTIRLYRDDCRSVLPHLPPVDTVLTDPPYELGFMGKEWDKAGVSFEPSTWRAIAKACRPGAVMLAFGGTRTWHRIACAIEDAGWEIRDTLMWLYGTGFPKSLNISKAIDKAAGAVREVAGDGIYASRRVSANGGRTTGAFEHDGHRVTAPATAMAKLWDGYGTALKPAWEPVLLAMNPLDGTFAHNAQRHGVAGLWIEGGRIDLDGDYKSRANGRPSLTGLGDKYDPASANKPDTVGRFPANLVLDEDAARLLDEQTGTLTSGTGAVKRSTGAGYRPNALGAESRPVGTPMIEYGDSGGASRFFYTAKASRSERGVGNDHPTVKPLKLMQYLARLTRTPHGGVVLDPFMGSGTGALAAILEGRMYIGIEQDQHSFDIAVGRIESLLASRKAA